MSGISSPVSNPIGVAVYVEMRKLINTRSSRWLLFSMTLLGILMIVAFVAVSASRNEPIDMSMMLAALALPAGIGAPIISILAITSDWQHRDNVKFFVLQPRRGVLLLAKYIAVAIFGLATMLVICAVAFAVSAGFSVFTSSDIMFGSLNRSVWLLLCATLVGVMSGAAVASALLSTPLAIVFVLFQSFVFDSLIGLVAGDATPFLQSATFTNVLTEGGNAAAAASSAVIWILIPCVIGIWRNRTKDVV
ncbi:hypothetical protein StoSoilA2_11470 [Arthrobacter sp. StoSoilA2]|uniref:hypothetical protein n=1 Tax=Arthrobacter sp. StoSoilA2 TaxID=2830990 RepID=UPI001CC4DBA1|nr:hypothetical protein [Arthrobacter sp. StoSoilA2]BCW35091.1 hypothetical protein StoSoilA2_11470 [Arthrobacter sp. StoSoilA2]